MAFPIRIWCMSSLFLVLAVKSDSDISCGWTPGLAFDTASPKSVTKQENSHDDAVPPYIPMVVL